jgi:pentatricopeptide repeat protein
MNLIRFHLGYVKNNIPEKTLDLFEQMPFEPNNVIIAIIFSACAQSSTDRAKKIGKELLRHMSKTYQNNYVYTSAINMLMNHNEVLEAEHLFNMMKQKDIVSYGALMKGYLNFMICYEFDSISFRLCKKQCFRKSFRFI